MVRVGPGESSNEVRGLTPFWYSVRVGTVSVHAKYEVLDVSFGKGRSKGVGRVVEGRGRGFLGEGFPRGSRTNRLHKRLV